MILPRLILPMARRTLRARRAIIVSVAPLLIAAQIGTQFADANDGVKLRPKRLPAVQKLPAGQNRSELNSNKTISTAEETESRQPVVGVSYETAMANLLPPMVAHAASSQASNQSGEDGNDLAERFSYFPIVKSESGDDLSVQNADSQDSAAISSDHALDEAFTEVKLTLPSHASEAREVIPTPTPNPIELSIAPLPRWQLSLEESIQLGLANNKDIAVITPAPSIATTLVSIERGDFDPVVGVSVFGGQDDRQVRSNIANFNSGQGFQDRDFFRPLGGLNQAFVRQRLASGGSYEIGYGTNYQRFNPVGTDLLLPSGWESSLNFQFSQPLMRGRGAASSQQRLRVAAARQRQTEYEFRAELREVVRGIDIAYWKLAGAQKKTDAAQRLVQIAEKAAKDEAARKQLGQSAKPDVLQTQRLLLEFKIALEQSRRAKDVAELRLRRELGIAQLAMGFAPSGAGYDSRYDLPIEVVSDVSETVSSGNLESAIAQAMSRPELSAIQARIDQAKIALAAARNNLLPDVTAHAVFSKTGLEKNLDDSVSTLFDDDFGTWGAGVTYQRRLKQRSEQAAVRRQCLQISQYQAEQNRIAHDIVAKLRTLAASIEGYQRTLQQRESLVGVLTEQQEGFDELYKDNRVTLFQRLENARALQAAESERIDTWVLSTVALADWRFERGDDASSLGIDVTTHSAW
jgi:outer membrane protein TolC